MLPHPTDRYELEKTRQHQVWEIAEQDRRAREVAEKKQRRPAHSLPGLGSLLSALALWLKARGKAQPIVASHHIPAPTESPASRCQRSAASAFNHPCLQPIGASHPHHA
jgi:hypothetical protein